MSINVRDRKILWTKAGNRCSYRYKGEVCDKELVVVDGEKLTLVGHECHIVSEKPKAARYTAISKGRNSYDNIILMCPEHHKIIDDNENEYTVDVLQKMKQRHENSIVERLKRQEIERIIIKDSAFRTEVKHADEAIGMQVNRPAELSNVRSELVVQDVRRAVGFSTNQGFTARMMFCSKCNGQIPLAFTGAPPSSIVCPHCGQENSLH
jgi:hypothetical protein